VLDLEEVEGKGLYMKARVDFQPESSPLRYIYNAIKKGTYKGLSVGGYFRRKLTNAGWRIADMDFTEVSVTPVPKHSGTSFAVVAGKALADTETPEEVAHPDEGVTLSPEDEARLVGALDQLGNVFSQIGKRSAGDPNVTVI
jgi:phage head maturation protease